MKLLPLWSGVMVHFFGYGKVVSSSTAVECSFYKIKNIILKHYSLLTDIETCLDNHILSWHEGASLLGSIQVPKPDIRNSGIEHCCIRHK